MEAFIDMTVEFALRGKSLVLKDIAEACGIEGTRPSKWNRIPEFRAAVAVALRNTHDALSAAARAAMYQLAIRGNLPAFDRIRAVEKDIEALSRPLELGDASTAGGVMAAAGVHVHVHAIPERQPFETLPPPLTAPALSAGTQTPAPVK